MYYYIKFNRIPKKAETFSLASSFKFVKANSESEAKNKLKKWVLENYPNTAKVEITTILEAGNERQTGGSWSSSNILDKSPLSFMDSVVSAFRDEKKFIFRVTYKIISPNTPNRPKNSSNAIESGVLKIEAGTEKEALVKAQRALSSKIDYSKLMVKAYKPNELKIFYKTGGEAGFISIFSKLPIGV